MTSTVHVAGPRGIGSSTVAFALYLLLVGDGHRTGYVDLSQLQFATPAPGPGAVRRNLATLWRGYRDAGATGLVVAGRADVRLPGATLCWLTADRDRHVERLELRRRGLGPPVPGDDLRGRPESELARLADAPAPAPDGVEVLLDTSALDVGASARLLRHHVEHRNPTGPPA